MGGDHEPRLKTNQRRSVVAAALATAVIGGTTAIVVPGAVFAANIVPVTSDASGCYDARQRNACQPGGADCCVIAAVPLRRARRTGRPTPLSFFPTNGPTFGILTTGT